LVALVSALLSTHWPFVAFFVDLYLWAGQPWIPYRLFSLTVTCIVFFLSFLIFRLLIANRSSRRRSGPFRVIASALLVIGLYSVYPALRSSWQEARLRDAPGDLTIVFVTRTLRSGSEEVPRGLVWTSAENLKLNELPGTWPFSWLLPEATDVIVVGPEQRELLNEALCEGGFFTLPETLDPRGRQDHADYSLAAVKGTRVWRVFGRLSDDSFGHLDSLVKSLKARFGAAKTRANAC